MGEEYAFDSSTSTIVGFDVSFTGPQLSLTSGAVYDKAESSNDNVGVQQGKETDDGQSNGISGTKTNTLGTVDTTNRNLRREIGTVNQKAKEQQKIREKTSKSIHTKEEGTEHRLKTSASIQTEAEASAGIKGIGEASLKTTMKA